ncbi:hypothetical protein [Streptomyces sp. NPDC048272]|uniref:hypothetical protein n=1 Tax=Streptomyces sp. NPDC048272 TaxID=3154616 RepID=UPI00343E0ABC
MKITTPRRSLTTALLALATLAGAMSPVQAQPVAQGRQAAVALPGYQMLRSEPITVNNLAGTAFACPAGKVAVSGGADVQGTGAVLVASHPTIVDSASGWAVVARQVGKPQVTFSAFLVCVNSAALPGYQIVHLNSAEIANRGSRGAACPTGKVVVGGGAATRGTDPALRVSLAPRPKGSTSLWTASGQSLTGTTVGLAVDAICANPLPGYEIVELAATETPNQTARTQACPSGKAPLSGGVAGFNSAVVTSSHPEAVSGVYRWAAGVREASRPNAISSLTVVCANLT